MLEFITDTCSIKRLQNKKSYVVVSSGVEIDIQPVSWEQLGADLVYELYTGYIETEDDWLVLYNDKILIWSKEYVVQSTRFWKGDNVFPSHFELTLTENKTWG